MKCRSCLLLSLLWAAPLLAGETYLASGLVLRADREHLSLEVSCQAIPGYMDAMVMTFPVHNAGALDGLKPGMMIDFKLDVRKDAAYAEQNHINGVVEATPARYFTPWNRPSGYHAVPRSAEEQQRLREDLKERPQ